MDYGGENLDDLLERYKRKYEQALICAGDPPLFGPNAFPLQAVYEFVGLYETRYPERKGALANFFREVDAEFLEHMIKIKCMVYMLEEKAARKMAGFMKRKRGIFIKMFFEKNTAKGGAQAFFTHTFLGKPKIMYYEIASKSELKPPYKTFFHEFGHAIDNLSKRGFGYYSDTFKHSQKAGKKNLIYDSRLGAYSIGTTTGIYKKTIHEWACLDLENMLIQVAYDLMKKNITSMPDKRRYLSPASTPLIQFQAASYAIYGLILCWDGAKKVNGLWGRPFGIEAKELYEDICTELNGHCLVAASGTPVLPKDLFGGITNNQVGGGHRNEYWFNKRGKRINKISREAFAGYFEYRLTMPDLVARQAVINPYSCFTYTSQALEKMFCDLMG